MSIRGRWRVVEMPGYDMAVAGAYILFGDSGGEFVLDCLTGSIHGACDGNAVEFSWDGNDEMEPAIGDGWAELQEDGTLEGEICLHNGDEIPFIARRATTSSTACSHVRFQGLRRNYSSAVADGAGFWCAQQETGPEDAG